MRTDRLLFRRHEPGDEAAFVEMHTDAEVRWYVGGRAWSVDEAVARFRTQFLGRPRRTYGLWATILLDENKYVGMCGLSGTRLRPRLGYYIARPYWGMGLAMEAARAFVDFGFHRLHAPRILADAERGNSASEHILDRLGFRACRDEALASGRVIRHYEIFR